MLGDRPKVEQAAQAVCGRLRIQVKRSPTDHAGGKWRLSFTSVHGRTGTLELDLSFVLRTPLWPLATQDSRALGSVRATLIPVLDIHELAAGKTAEESKRRSEADCSTRSCGCSGPTHDEAFDDCGLVGRAAESGMAIPTATGARDCSPRTRRAGSRSRR
jgi:hypothetical protein